MGEGGRVKPVRTRFFPGKTMPFALILAVAASLGIHAAALFGINLDLSTEPETPVLFAELKPMPKALVAAPEVPPPQPVKAPPKKKPPTPRPKRTEAPPPPASEPQALIDSDALPLPESPQESASADPVPETVPVIPTEEESPSPASVPSPRLPERGEIRYRVDRGDQGFEIGVATSDWEIRDDTYVLRLSSETTGLAWLLKSVRIDMESRGRLTAAGLQPEHFSVRRNQAENTEQVAFDWAQKLVHVGNSPPQALDDGAQDLLSFNFHLGFMPQASVSGTLPIATSKKYGRYRLEIVGDETIETPAGTMNTLHLRAPGANTTELWLAYDYLLLPVRIRHEDRKGNAMVQTATSIRLGAVPDEAAP